MPGARALRSALAMPSARKAPDSICGRMPDAAWKIIGVSFACTACTAGAPLPPAQEPRRGSCGPGARADQPAALRRAIHAVTVEKRQALLNMVCAS